VKKRKKKQINSSTTNKLTLDPGFISFKRKRASFSKKKHPFNLFFHSFPSKKNKIKRENG